MVVFLYSVIAVQNNGLQNCDHPNFEYGQKCLFLVSVPNGGYHNTKSKRSPFNNFWENTNVKVFVTVTDRGRWSHSFQHPDDRNNLTGEVPQHVCTLFLLTFFSSEALLVISVVACHWLWAWRNLVTKTSCLYGTSRQSQSLGQFKKALLIKRGLSLANWIKNQRLHWSFLWPLSAGQVTECLWERGERNWKSEREKTNCSWLHIISKMEKMVLRQSCQYSHPLCRHC